MNAASKFAAVCLSLLAVAPARAELFRPETVQGAVLGGVAGAVIGHNNGRNGWEGAAYGALAGGVLGSLVGEARDRAPGTYRHDSRYRRDSSPRWSFHVGYSSGHYRPYGYSRYRPSRPWHRHDHHWHSPAWAWSYQHSPAWTYRRDPWVRPLYRDSWSHPRYATRGALWGGLAGAVIGHNHGRRGWEGAAYGVAGGYALGTLADARAERAAAERAALAAWQSSNTPQATTPSQVTIINNYYNAPTTPMTSANRAFGR